MDGSQGFEADSENSDSKELTEQLLDRLANLWPDSDLQDETSNARPSIRRVGKYDLLRELGRGGFGVVYLATDSQTNTKVALKVPRASALGGAERLNRFQLEAEMTSRLDHPGIVRIHDADVISPTPFIAAEFCDGLDLAKWLELQDSPPSWQEAAKFVVGLTDAIEYAHSQGVFHRDLKPSNILLVAIEPIEGHNKLAFGQRPLSKFQAKITDFGLGKLVDDAITDTRSSLIIGTPLYMSPEQFDSSSSASDSFAPTDIYSLGVILFELLTLRHPFVGRNHFETVDKIRNQPPERLRLLNSSVPKSLEMVCKTCLEKKPIRRYESAAQLAIDLRNCVTDKPTSRRSVSWASRVKDYCLHERRISEAGWFTVWAQIALSTWVFVFWTVVGILNWSGMSVLPNTTAGNVLFWLVALNPGLAWPLMWLGWKTTQRNAWAIWIGLFLTVSAFPACILGCIGQPLVFPELYANRPVFSALTHLLIFTLHLTQAGLLLVALIAIKQGKRPR